MTDELAGWKRSTAQMGIVNVGLQHFSRTIIGHVLSQLPLDDTSLQAIKRGAVLAIKNMDASGIKIEDEASLIGEAAELVEKMLEITIVEGRKLKKE